MPRSFLAAALLLLLAAPARGFDGEDLIGTIESPLNPESPAPSTPGPVAPEQNTEEEGTEAPRNYAPLPPKESPRFNLDEKPRLRRWLTKLCRQEAVAPDLSERVRFTRDHVPSLTQPGNKQGSLLLLLENYAELAEFRDHCEAARRKDPAACVQKGRLPKPWDVKDQSGANAWLAFGAKGFWSEVRQRRDPAGIPPRTDLLAASRSRVDTLKTALKKDFFELRDAADLDGKPGSGAKARKLVEAVKAESTCGTRALLEGPERHPAAEAAQK